MGLLSGRSINGRLGFALGLAGLMMALFVSPGALAKPAAPLPHVEKRGSGDTNVILIHGLNADWRAWKTFMTDVNNEDRYTMYAVTLPGFGGSEAPPKEMDGDSKTPLLDNAVEAVADMIEQRNIEDPVVIGHASLGGFITLRLGIEHPRLVGKMIVVDSLVPALPLGGNLPPEPVRQQIVDELAPQFENLDEETWNSMQDVRRLVFNKEYHELLQQMMDESPRSVATRYLIETMRVDLTDELVGMQTPTLFMYSWPANMTDNEQQTRRTSMQIATKVPSGDYVTVGRSQRYIMLDRPDGFTFLVDRYLTEGDVEAGLP